VNSITHQRQWLYLLTALVLLMQSFAIWHDASHPFHLAEDQCQRFESVSHSPSITPALTLIPEFSTQFSVDKPLINITYAEKRLREQHAIRAPPIFS